MAEQPTFTIDRFGSTFYEDGTVTSGYPAKAPLCVRCGHHASSHHLVDAEAPADPGARFACIVKDCGCRDFREERVGV